MGERIGQFCEDLRNKLTSIDNAMQALKAKIDSEAQKAEQDVRARLDAVTKGIERDRAKVATAQADIRKWIENQKATTETKIAEWKTKHEKARLKDRADFAERYAAAAAIVASAALDEAQQASLEAWLARKDADTAQGTKAA